MAKRLSKWHMICMGCALITSVAGCETTERPSADMTTEQRLTELKTRYDTGALSKDEYERQRAQIMSNDASQNPQTIDAIRGVVRPR